MIFQFLIKGSERQYIMEADSKRIRIYEKNKTVLDTEEDLEFSDVVRILKQYEKGVKL